jgi:hypothetical protein
MESFAERLVVHDVLLSVISADTLRESLRRYKFVVCRGDDYDFGKFRGRNRECEIGKPEEGGDVSIFGRNVDIPYLTTGFTFVPQTR